MELRKYGIFMLIGAVLSMLEIVYYGYELYQWQREIVPLLITFLALGLPVGLLITGINLIKIDTEEEACRQLQNSSYVLLIASISAILVRLYRIYETFTFFSTTDYISTGNLIENIITNILLLLTPFALLFLVQKLFQLNAHDTFQDKLKGAAIFLMVAAGGSALANLYWYVQGYSYRGLVGLLAFAESFSILVLSLGLMSKTKKESNEESNNMSVSDWLITYLIMLIPIVGLVFIIIWANDENNKVKKNWAVATLIWMGIAMALTAVFYGILLANYSRY
jgi:hypothetical protein